MGVNGIYGLSGSGLDVESMVKVGMLSKQSEYEKMQQKFTKNEWKKSEYLEVYSEIQTFNSSTISKYKMSSNMDARSATSANTSVVTATANANAAPMTHYVKVDSLASSAYLIGTEMNRANNNATDKNLLSSVLFNAGTTIAASETSGKVKFNGNDVDATAAVMSFSINDGVNGLLASTASDSVTASATPDAATGTYKVKIFEVATAPAPVQGGELTGVTSNSHVTDLLGQAFGISGTALAETITTYSGNTNKAFAFTFGDGITDTKIEFSFAELVNTNTTVADFISGLNSQFEAAGLNLNALFTTNDTGKGGSFSLNNSADNPLGSKNAVKISISKGDINGDIPLSAMVGLAQTLFGSGTTVPGHSSDNTSGTPFSITGTGDNLTVTYELKGKDAAGTIAKVNADGSTSDTVTLIFDGAEATAVSDTTTSGSANTLDISGLTVIAESITDSTAYPTGVEIKNIGKQNITVTYKELLDGFTLNDLTAKINSQGTNIRATYDSVQDRISFYNQKSGEDNQINIGIGTGTAAENAATFFNALGLKQSANGVLDTTAKSFDTDTTVSQAGTNSSVMIDGVSLELDSNKATVAGVTYNFQNVTDTQTTVTVSQDTDAIVKYVKSFVDDYNALMKKLYEWYDEKPNSDYKPLTASQKEGMKDEQIEKWEEKAKAGLLYHDQTLSKIISDIRSAVTSNVDGINSKYKNIFSLGISTTGLKGQLTIDEDKLKAALAEDSEAVYNVFAKLDADDDFDSNGVAQRLGDIFQKSMKSIKSVSGTTASITEDSELNNLLRELQTKMSNFKRMMDAFESKLYKKYDAMEVALASLGSQLNYVTSAFQ